MIAQEINNIIDTGNMTIMSAIFNDLIKEHTTDVALPSKKKWEEYGAKVPILTKEHPIGTPEYKANNKLRNDYRSIIIDQGLTYFLGNPISVSVVPEAPDSKVLTLLIKDFRVANSMDDNDMQVALYCAVCGSAGRLLYINTSGAEKIMALPPWQVIFVYNPSVEELEYAMIYYKMKIKNAQTGQSVDRIRIEWYDKKFVYYYVQTENPAGEVENYYKPDDLQPHNPQPHGFDGVPVVEYINNDMKFGDFDRTKDLIDAYDRLISDGQNELEDFRNAYMVFKGLAPNEKTMENAKLTGAFGSEDPEFSVEFLVKELSGTFHENHKKTINDNIYRFSKRVDMNDEKFSGATQSGENRKWKMLALENDAVMKERKYTKSEREMYRLLFSVWKKKGVVLEVAWLEMTFTRKLPIDLEYYAGIVTALEGRVPRRILFGLLPFIKDVDAAIEELQNEKEESIDLTQITMKDENDKV